MPKNKPQDKQECFIQEEFDQIQSQFLNSHINDDFNFKIHQQLPANELRSISHPYHLAPRTLILNKYMNLLPPVLNQSCIEEQTVSQGLPNKIKILNKSKSTLSEFFDKKNFKEIYNKLNHFSSDSKNFSGTQSTILGKLLSIDSVSDYNHKMFKQLQKQQQKSKVNLEDTIDANFESGNLCRAFVSAQDLNEYYLIIQNDINTYGYNIWFFFRFRNVTSGRRTFNIMNMIKKTDNYKKGLQISIYSIKKKQKQDKSWFKGGDRISFGETNFTRIFHLTEKYYYLSFQYDFQQSNDDVYFAFNQPYTYSRMINHISNIQQKCKNNLIQFQIKKIGHTLADNVITALNISTHQFQNKETILIIARQHPCETVSSFVCEGIINYIIKLPPQIQVLLQKYQFIIIPMINPDGVIHGSSRCNLAGFDLNRQWSEFLIKQFTPQTHRIKKYLYQLHKQNPIKYFFDLHGHGKKFNSFFFSCKKGDSPQSRLIELSMNKMEPSFNIMDCTYGIGKDKQNTIRSQLNQMGIQNCYTLQSSLMGYVTPEGQIKQYTEQDLFGIGVSILKSIFIHDSSTQTVFNILGFSKQELLLSSQNIFAKISERQKDQKKNIFDDNASDSDPDGDILDISERLQKFCLNNANLKKKVAETIKKEKAKMKKYDFKSVKKQQRKLSSNSQHESTGRILTSVNLQNSKQCQEKEKQLISLEKRNMTKMSFHNKRKTIYSKIIKQRKQTPKFQENILINQNQTPIKNSFYKNRQILNSTEMKFTNKIFENETLTKGKNNKASCSIIYEYPNEGLFNTRKMSYKLKTQGCLQSTKWTFTRDSSVKKGIKISDLKQQSLKQLLSDTFSVLKIKTNLSVKRCVNANPYQKQNKQRLIIQNNEKYQNFRPSTPLKKDFRNSQTRMKTYSHSQNKSFSHRPGKDKGFASFHDASFRQKKFHSNNYKYKRFESFLFSGITEKSPEKMKSSVFYYFPVL